MLKNGEFSLSDLLAIEDDAALLDFFCAETGLVFWPQIRTVFFRLIMSDLLYAAHVTGKSTTKVQIARCVGSMARSLLHNICYPVAGKQQADICIMADGVADQLVDGKFFNRLSDHFVSAAIDRTLVVQDHFEWRWPFPRHHDNLMLHAPFQARNAVLGRVLVSDRHRDQAKRLISIVEERARRKLGWILNPFRKMDLVQMLSRKIAALPAQYHGYCALLERIQPKLLMVGAACYGPSAALIAAAKDANVVTAEYQHGAVSAGHDAYNFAPTILTSSAYQRTWPEYFLGYGAWWNSQINVATCKLALGNPSREAKLERLYSENRPKQQVLVLSDGIEFDLYLNIAKQISARVAKQGLSVVLRPHPLERTKIEALHGQNIGSVRIDQNMDLYESFSAALMVVSEVSTGLFEAVGIVKHIFVWDTQKSRFAYPEHPFRKFSTIESLIEILEDEQLSGHQILNNNEIWAPRWKDKYYAFLAKNGIT